MGDCFQTIVDRDASLDDARQLSAEILNWLVERGIVQQTVTECVLSKTGSAHPPGENYEQVVEYDGFDIRALITNGLDIVVDHRVFDPGQGRHKRVCPQCGIITDCDKEWFTAVGQWYGGEPQKIIRCANCGYTNAITEWSANPPWGFGNLGFVFWNWAPLNQAFINEFARRLGHRIAYVAGKR